MWPNSQETTDLITFTEETLMENLIFSAVRYNFVNFIFSSFPFFKTEKELTNLDFVCSQYMADDLLVIWPK